MPLPLFNEKKFKIFFYIPGVGVGEAAEQVGYVSGLYLQYVLDRYRRRKAKKHIFDSSVFSKNSRAAILDF